MNTFWGKPEVFWVGVQAICAALGVVGLIAYTYYARQQAAYAQATLRASLTPYVAVISHHSEAMENGLLKFEGCLVSYRNVGQGAALRLRSWHRHADEPVLAAFEARKIIKPGFSATPGVLNGDDLPRDGIVEAKFNLYSKGYPRLYVLEADDPAGGFHQILLLLGLQGGPQIHNLSALRPDRLGLLRRLASKLPFLKAVERQ